MTTSTTSLILSDQDPVDVLYSEEYFTVTRTNLIINYYYFPLGTSKTIPLRKIVSINTAKELGLKWYEQKQVSNSRFFYFDNDIRLNDISYSGVCHLTIFGLLWTLNGFLIKATIHALLK